MEAASSLPPPPRRPCRRRPDNCGSPTRISTELNNDDEHDQQPEMEDLLSVLPDDVLLCILERVDDLSTIVRTSALSRRWRRLPWLVPNLNIDVDDFIPGPRSGPTETNVIHAAMLTTATVAKSLFAKPKRESIVASLQLTLYLIDAFSCNIGPLVCDAIDRGLLKDLDLSILDETRPCDSSDVQMLQLAKDMDNFFNTYPSVFRCLTRLYLRNVSFFELDMHHLLFECCTQLKHLSLFHCDAGLRSLWKIDAPNSKLSVLELDTCYFERVEVVCLPKLEKLHWDTWISEDGLLSFGCVPSLGELHLADGSDLNQHSFKLSELLHGTTGIHTLTLNFRGENLWIQPEMKQLTSSFRKIRKLSILGIFVEFDLLWTMALLEAAPSIEVLQIQVWEHECNNDAEGEPHTFPERRNPRWGLDSRGSKNLLLRELQVVCFKPLKQQLAFIRAVLERAPTLQKIVLRDELCECDALGSPPRPSADRVFPKCKDEQETVVKRVTDGAIFSGQVIFDDGKKL